MLKYFRSNDFLVFFKWPFWEMIFWSTWYLGSSLGCGLRVVKTVVARICFLQMQNCMPKSWCKTVKMKILRQHCRFYRKYGGVLCISIFQLFPCVHLVDFFLWKWTKYVSIGETVRSEEAFPSNLSNKMNSRSFSKTKDHKIRSDTKKHWFQLYALFQTATSEKSRKISTSKIIMRN
jgi:hypothetical protein